MNEGRWYVVIMKGPFPALLHKKSKGGAFYCLHKGELGLKVASYSTLNRARAALYKMGIIQDGIEYTYIKGYGTLMEWFGARNAERINA